MSDEARHLAQTLLTALQGKFDDVDHLQSTLEPIISAFELADASAAPVSEWHTLIAEDKHYILRTSWPLFQRELATRIVIDWLPHLQQHDLAQNVWIPFFVPTIADSTYATPVAISAYAVLGEVLTDKATKSGLSSTTSLPANIPTLVYQQAQETLSKLVQEYDLVNIFAHVRLKTTASKWLFDWRSFVTLYLALPSKLASQDKQTAPTLPDNLTWRPVCSRASQSLVKILQTPFAEGCTEQQAAAFLLNKLIRSGFLAPITGLPSFWSTISATLSRLTVTAQPSDAFIRSWLSSVNLLVTSDFSTLSTTLLQHVQRNLPHNTDATVVRRTATLLLHLLGPAQAGDTAVWESCVERTLLERPVWNETMARILVCWVTVSPGSNTNLQTLLTLTSTLWCNVAIIERAGSAYASYLTTIIVLIVGALPKLDETLIHLAQSGNFLRAVGKYLGSTNPPIRMCGMYVAETVSQKTVDPNSSIKPLNFGDAWDENSEGFPYVKQLRALTSAPLDSKVVGWQLPQLDYGQVEEIDDTRHGSSPPAHVQPRTQPVYSKGGPKLYADKIQVIASTASFEDYDEDEEDDLQPFALPKLPDATELADIHDMATYKSEKNKVKPPVYIPDLSAYLKSTEDAEKLKIGLREAEGLIRRKASWGFEIRDAAIDLAITLAGLQDNFDIENFDEQRLAALSTLNASAPSRSVPAVIEQFFSHQYSISQRFAMLSSLAISARELAGLPSLTPAKILQNTEKLPMPKLLPPKLHNHYIQAQQPTDATPLPARTPQLDAITDSIVNDALSATRETAEHTVPGATREKLLTVRSSRSRAPASSIAPNQSSSVKHPIYTELAIETYIMPLINRFWLYLRDAATSARNIRGSHFGGDTMQSAALFQPLLLGKFVATLGVLTDAARNSPHFLAVIAPETLQLALALRSIDKADEVVQTSTLQLMLIAIDISVSIDGGRELARNHAALMWQAKDWAEVAWTEQEQGRFSAPSALAKAAAALLLRLDTVTSKTLGYH